VQHGRRVVGLVAFLNPYFIYFTVVIPYALKFFVQMQKTSNHRSIKLKLISGKGKMRMMK